VGFFISGIGSGYESRKEKVTQKKEKLIYVLVWREDILCGELEASKAWKSCMEVYEEI
jgi:hypothetical protein